ncbi:MAG TPA: serine/threonine-protein kinase [Candidatus Dormibacteraeota bacterium]
MTPAPAGYELLDELGHGATGTVHLARHVALGREVVVKRIVGGASSQDPETVLRFERQARLLAGLDHPGIVRVHELVRVGSDLFLVMEHVTGGDLRRVLAEGPPPEAEAARILTEIAAALDHAHERGVVHLDVKPSNVLVAADGAIKVGDFGLAALLERQARSRTGRAGAVGSLAYLAPEQARGDLAVDRRADVYSLGVIAYEMLVGRPPFAVDPADPYATVRAQMEEPPPRPGRLVPGFPPLLEAALLWALEKPPERRPATAGELAAALRDALALSPTIGAYTEDTRRLPARRSGVDLPLGPPDAGGSRSPASRWWVPIAVAAIGVLAAAAVFVAARTREAPPAAGAGLAVTAITAGVEPAGGAVHCPRATVTLRAAVATNGSAGTLRYEWLRPDGWRVGGGGQVAVHDGQRSAAVTTSVDFDGNAPAQGVVALHVLSPASVYSQPLAVTYACP